MSFKILTAVKKSKNLTKILKFPVYESHYLTDHTKNAKNNDIQEMKESKAVYVTKHKIRDDQNFVYHLYRTERLNRCRRTENNNFGSQYDSKRDNGVCTSKNSIRKYHEVRYFSGIPKQIYACHGSRGFVDIGVGSVKTIQRRRVKRVYLPETDETGVGSSDLSSFIFRRRYPKVINVSSCYFDHKKTSSKCIGVIHECNIGCPVNQKLSPIIHTKSGATSPKRSLIIKKDTEIGSNMIENKIATAATQVENQEAEKAVMISTTKKFSSTVTVCQIQQPKKTVVEHKPPLKVSEHTQKNKYSNEITEDKKKADAENKKEPAVKQQPTYSSDSLVQHVHNLENPSDVKNSRTSFPDPMENKLEREYRKMFTTTKSKPSCDKPIPEFKSNSLLRRRFEALRRGIVRKDELNSKKKDSILMVSDNLMNSGIPTHKDASVTSDPPSLISRSFSNTEKYKAALEETKRDKKKTTQQKKEKRGSSEWNQLQTNSADSESQGVKGMFKLWGKKFNFEEDIYNKRQATPMPSYDKPKKAEPAKIDQKESKKEGKKFFFFKKKSKDKNKNACIAKKDVTAGRCEIKEGLVLKIGEVGASRVKSRISEEDTGITHKTWLKRFMSETLGSARSVNIRWNNSAYGTSSSTLFELLDSVYKNSNVISHSDVTGESSYYKSFTKQVNFVQDIEAWMIPHTVTDKPVKQIPIKQVPLHIFSNRDVNERNVDFTTSDQKWYIEKSEAFSNKIEVVLHSNNTTNVSNPKASSEYLRIDIPGDFFDTSSDDCKQNHSSDEEVYKIVEYETNSEIRRARKAASELHKGDNLSTDIKVIVSVKDSKSLESKLLETVIKRLPALKDTVVQGNEDTESQRCDVIGVGIITQRDLREIRKPILKVREDTTDEESEPAQQLHQKKCEFAESYLQEYYRHWSPFGFELYPWCVSETHVRSSSDKSTASFHNLGDGSKSCPNIYEDLEQTIVTSCETSSKPCKHCTYEELTKEKLYDRMLKKFKKNSKDKTETDVVKKPPNQKRRVIPKDSIEVFKKRKINETTCRSEWAKLCKNCKDVTCAIPSDKSTSNCKMEPICEKPKVTCGKKPTEGILNFNRPKITCEKHAVVNPIPSCEIPQPPCKELCDTMKDPKCYKPNSPSCNTTSTCTSPTGTPICPKPKMPPEISVPSSYCVPRQPDSKQPVCPAGLPICKPLPPCQSPPPCQAPPPCKTPSSCQPRLPCETPTQPCKTPLPCETPAPCKTPPPIKKPKPCLKPCKEIPPSTTPPHCAVPPPCSSPPPCPNPLPCKKPPSCVKSPCESLPPCLLAPPCQPPSPPPCPAPQTCTKPPPCKNLPPQPASPCLTPLPCPTSRSCPAPQLRKSPSPCKKSPHCKDPPPCKSPLPCSLPSPIPLITSCKKPPPCKELPTCQSPPPCPSTPSCPSLPSCKILPPCKKSPPCKKFPPCNKPLPFELPSPCPTPKPCKKPPPCESPPACLSPPSSSPCLTPPPCLSPKPCKKPLSCNKPPPCESVSPCPTPKPCKKPLPCKKIPPCESPPPCLSPPSSPPCLTPPPCLSPQPCKKPKPCKKTPPCELPSPCPTPKPCKKPPPCKSPPPCLSPPSSSPCLTPPPCLSPQPCKKPKPCKKTLPCELSSPCPTPKPCKKPLPCKKPPPCESPSPCLSPPSSPPCLTPPPCLSPQPCKKPKPCKKPPPCKKSLPCELPSPCLSPPSSPPCLTPSPCLSPQPCKKPKPCKKPPPCKKTLPCGSPPPCPSPPYCPSPPPCPLPQPCEKNPPCKMRPHCKKLPPCESLPPCPSPPLSPPCVSPPPCPSLPSCTSPQPRKKPSRRSSCKRRPSCKAPLPCLSPPPCRSPRSCPHTPPCEPPPRPPCKKFPSVQPSCKSSSFNKESILPRKKSSGSRPCNMTVPSCSKCSSLSRKKSKLGSCYKTLPCKPLSCETSACQEPTCQVPPCIEPLSFPCSKKPLYQKPSPIPSILNWMDSEKCYKTKPPRKDYQNSKRKKQPAKCCDNPSSTSCRNCCKSSSSSESICSSPPPKKSQPTYASPKQSPCDSPKVSSCKSPKMSPFKSPKESPCGSPKTSSSSCSSGISLRLAPSVSSTKVPKKSPCRLPPCEVLSKPKCGDIKKKPKRKELSPPLPCFSPPPIKKSKCEKQTGPESPAKKSPSPSNTSFFPEPTCFPEVPCPQKPRKRPSSPKPCLSKPSCPPNPCPAQASRSVTPHCKSKISGVYLKMKPAPRKTCSDNCSSWAETADVTIRIKETTPSTEEIREPLNIRVQDEDGRTLYERKDYTCGNQHNTLLGDVYKESKINRAITPLTVTNMVDDDKKDLISYVSDKSLVNTVEINFKLRITQGDKTTEIDIGDDSNDKRNVRSNIKKSNPEVFIVDNDTAGVAEESPKNDINIKITLRNFKSKLKNKLVKSKKRAEDFSRKISDKFHTVSTGYSDVEDDNVFSIHRATINLASSIDVSHISSKIQSKTPNFVASSQSTDIVVTDITEDENIEETLNKKDSQNEKNQEPDTKELPPFNESEIDEDAKLVDSNTSEYNDNSVESRLAAREQKKILLKKVFQKVGKRNKNKENVRELRDMLKIILTDSSENEEKKVSTNDLAKDVTYTSLKPNYFRDTDSMNNYYRIDSTVSMKDSKVDTIYPTAEANSKTSNSSDTEDNDMTFRGCMCSKVAERLNQVTANKIGCCCRQTLRNDEETNCDIRNAADYFLLNYQTTEVVDVETQNSRRLTSKVNSYNISVHSTSKRKSFAKTSEDIEVVEEIKIIKSPRLSSRASRPLFQQEGMAEEPKIKTRDLFEEIKVVTSPISKRATVNDSNRQNLDQEFNTKQLYQNSVTHTDKEVVRKLTELSVERSKNESNRSKKRERPIDDTDILQSYAAKKAVLEIYAKKAENGEKFVAKLPKFVAEKESEIAKNFEQIAANSYKSMCRENVVMYIKR